MKSIIIQFLAVVAAVPEQPSFEEWAATYGVNGDDMLKVKYNANVAEINRLNALGSTAVFGVNKFSGMTSEEFAATYLNYQDEAESLDNSTVSRFESSGSVASSIDWESQGGVTPVKDQGSCGSCWTFSIIATVEARHKILSGETLNLSEQQILDCSGGGSCSGGNVRIGFEYLNETAACTASSYPYTHKDGTCKSCTSSHLHVSSVILNDKTESAMASALNDAPTSLLLEGGMLQHYSSGVLDGDDVCKHNHAVLLVGYSSTYWKIKNSWGSDWGEHGYVRIARGGSNCGKFGVRTSNTRSIRLTSDTRRRRRTSRHSDVVV